MRERPILMSAPMVRALLAGTKTQTRRLILYEWEHGFKSRLAFARHSVGSNDFVTKSESYTSTMQEAVWFYSWGNARWLRSQYGQPGDRLWVRETWAPLDDRALVTQRRDGIAYAASTTSDGNEARKAYGVRWRPSIHMPRWASRITLEVTGVRVERLQDISDDDVLAEGTPGAWVDWTEAGQGFKPNSNGQKTRQFFYRKMWEDINGPGAWCANPWVWVVEFRRC